MARLSRIDVPGLPQHLIQRGNNQALCFFRPDDYQFYLNAVNEAAIKYQCQLHAYVLMPNHVHLLLTGEHLGSVSSFMQSVGRRYVRYINIAQGRTGTLWEGRFRSSIVESEPYLLTCYRYIELNPVRAGLVSDPGDYVWSSYRHHAIGERNGLIQKHDLYLALGRTTKARRQAYQALIQEALSDREVQSIRDHVNKGRVLGSAHFQDELGAMLSRRVQIRPVGRPTKQSEHEYS